MNAQLVLENVGVRLPNRVLFEGVNWSLYEGMRVTLAGRNGSGKSTLLKILAGQTEPTEGKCTVVGGRKLKIGFLDQTLLDRAVVEILDLKDKSLSPLSYIEARLHKTRSDSEQGEIAWETRKILSGLGFSREGMESPMGRLSGGWLLRMFIGATLLDRPEVLLLDEPTNHLDLSSIQWLEEFLEDEYRGSLILVTHDIALQKRTTDSLAILHGARFFFRTHQRDYLAFRESLGDEKRILEKNIEALEKKIEENMEFVRKFRAKAQTAARAQSKLKAAETLTEKRKELQERLARVQGFAYNLHFRFRLSGPGGKFPVTAKQLKFRYSENGPWILQNVAFDIKRGQRVAIIGDNGTGKTTLLNVVAERLRPTEGELLHGHAVEVGYFGQHQLDELSLEDSILDNLRARAIGVSLEELRGWLGAFGFSGNDEISKKARFLSGGERARLALLRILTTRINLCLLDEPTNHLDIETKALLKESIRNFEGTVMIVSHDREFVGDIADRIIYLSSDHQFTDHLGDLKSFFEKYPHLVRHTEGRAQLSRQTDTEKPPQRAEGSLSYDERKRLKNQMRSLEKKVATLEAEIEQFGKEKEALQTNIDSASPEERDALYQKLGAIESALHNRMIDWERFSTELEAIKSQR